MSLKSSLCIATLSLLALQGAHAAECNYTPDEAGFKFSFTGYGAPDKSYIVSGNTFKEYKVASETGKLVGATIEVDAKSLDTSHDLNNGMGGEWPASIPAIRNGNVVNGLFMNFKDPGKITGKIASIDVETINLDLGMNGVTKTIPMKYSVKDGVLTAEGTLDIIKDYAGEDAFKKFGVICTATWHKGKSWTDVTITFSVPVKEEQCK